MNNGQLSIRAVAIFYLIFNLIYVPIKSVRGVNTYRSYDWIFDLGERAEIDLTRLIIQSIIIIIVLCIVYSPGFKKAENGQYAGVIAFVTWLLIVPAFGLFIFNYLN